MLCSLYDPEKDPHWQSSVTAEFSSELWSGKDHLSLMYDPPIEIKSGDEVRLDWATGTYYVNGVAHVGKEVGDGKSTR